MMPNHRLLLLATLTGATLWVPGCRDAGSDVAAGDDPAVSAYFDAVRAEYSGERARATVAAIDGTFRLPGNAGFDSAIAVVVGVLDAAGYVAEDTAAAGAPLTYRIEHRPLDRPTWEPVDASLDLVSPTAEPLLRLSSNLNMVAINSFPTPPEGIEADVVRLGDGWESLDGLDLRGKIVYGETSVGRLFAEAVQKRGALGVLSYGMPSYTRPEENPTSIQFSSIPYDPEAGAWGLRLSWQVKERLDAALANGPVRVRVRVDTRLHPSDEATLVADIHGQTHPEERFVLSAHVQEPGANDNASGVAAQAELARTLGVLIRTGQFVPDRSVSMIWGDEIASTRRYVEDDSARAEGILVGLSLDMVGEDTEKTGGTFLIEKMPDPSAVWTRGDDRHTAWWGEGRQGMDPDELTGHYLNDFYLARCLDQAATNGWVVRTNPFEGGSDHVPFLRAGIPSVLAWHFTDQFYHTDQDRIDKVSAETLSNVGVATAVSVMTLVSADGATARWILAELEAAAKVRLQAEFALSRAALAAGGALNEQAAILRAWLDWYDEALDTTRGIEVGGASARTVAAIAAARERVNTIGRDNLARLAESN